MVSVCSALMHLNVPLVYLPTLQHAFPVQMVSILTLPAPYVSPARVFAPGALQPLSALN